MIYDIDMELFKKTFELKETIDPKKSNLIHATNVKFNMLPFVPNEKNIVLYFYGVIGAFVRLINKKTLSEQLISIESLSEKVFKYVECKKENKYKLLNIIEELYFTKDKKLVLFDLKAMNYIPATKTEEKVAQFLYDILYSNILDNEVVTSFSSQNPNVFDRLVYKALPELKEANVQNKQYLNLVPYVKNTFIEDLKYLVLNPSIMKDDLTRLLNLYYFFYISQLIIKLDNFFEADKNKIEEIFFTTDWEKLSKSRLGYEYGWKKLQGKLSNIFSHAVLLEMLNQTNLDTKFDYLGLKEFMNESNLEVEESLNNNIKKVIETYKEYVKDFNFELINNTSNEDTVFNNIFYLFRCIKGQFEQTKRDRANSAYSNWFITYCKENFLKNRHSLSYTLNLTEENILFLTKICIKESEKIKLKDLFIEFEKRGIFTDNKTKEEVTNFYERLNLIEKKSDSGDAQYVKRIL